MPGSATHFLERRIQRLVRAINGIGVGSLAVMMFLTGTDVTLRYIFNRPIAGFTARGVQLISRPLDLKNEY